jgi:hypothetical protein
MQKVEGWMTACIHERIPSVLSGLLTRTQLLARRPKERMRCSWEVPRIWVYYLSVHMRRVIALALCRFRTPHRQWAIAPSLCRVTHHPGPTLPFRCFFRRSKRPCWAGRGGEWGRWRAREEMPILTWLPSRRSPVPVGPRCQAMPVAMCSRS